MSSFLLLCSPIHDSVSEVDLVVLSVDLLIRYRSYANSGPTPKQGVRAEIEMFMQPSDNYE